MMLPCRPKFKFLRFQMTVNIQCKRPFSNRNIRRNIIRAARQLTRDLDSARRRNARGIVALSVSRVANTGEKMYRAANAEALSLGLTKEVRALVEPHPWRLIEDSRIIGSIFHLVTPSVIEDLGNLLSSGQQLVVYPAPEISQSDREVLQALFW